MNIKITDYLLERYLLKELPREQMEEISRMADADPGLKQKLQELEKDSTDILKKYPASSMAEIILDKAERTKEPLPRRAGHSFFFKPALSLAAIALVFLIAWPVIEKATDRPGIRMKGEPARLYIYRKNGPDAENLLQNTIVREKDLLQLAYQTDKPLFGVILSIDGNGAVTLHYPENDSAATGLVQHKKTPLSRSYELDNAPSFERFFLVVSEKEISVKNILESAKRLARSRQDSINKTLDLDNTFKQYSITLRKK